MKKTDVTIISEIVNASDESIFQYEMSLKGGRDSNMK